ncbi:MAG: CRISPR-associated endonuclease Cas2 [Eubacteriales bacterium]|nr:CRISPR-associated endonuclease Cas2 [Eubacteriales bacterium]
MKYRYMRMLLFFDLPVGTATQRREYRQFRRHLIKSGFIMLQESVYCKLVPNNTVLLSVKYNIIKNKPSSGDIMLLNVTEKQFSRMEFILGDFQTDVINSDERLIIL